MNIFKGKPIRLLTTLFSMLVSIAMLSACGGSGGGSDTTAGIGGTGIAAGKVTDFGSIYVNGNIFNTNQSQFIVDGNSSASENDLSIGMVVIVKAETNNGLFTGKALEVFYDDEIEGPVAATPVDVLGSNGTQKSFTIFGQTITIDESSTIFEGTTFAGLDANDVVEISGFRTSDTTIDATYVEFNGTLVPGTTEVELRGTISGYMPPTQEFMLDGVLITFDNMTDIKVSGVLDNGLFVEVEGIYFNNPSVLVHAEEIEEEEEGFGNDVDDVSLQGIISNFMAGPQTFDIDGQSIDFSGAQIEPSGAALENGLEVEVEGDIVGGVLIAEEVEVREGEAKLKAFVSSVDLANNSFEVSYFGGLGTVTIKVDAQTTFEDEKGPNPLEDLELRDLTPVADFVKIEGIEMLNDEVVAGTIKRIDDDDYKLEGVVDGFIPLTSITILGIIFPVDDSPVIGTEFEGFANAADFFTALDAEFTAGNNPEVEIEDEISSPQTPLGIADKVELD
ncbi:MAG: hypothetical protein KJN95_12795 [Gammaproteobacteria bacterium]|nr:hypothetical protein [Gammaproteobacteria bacterium]MBT8437398.1 hypothetical protein [Gammaproteobacteria bacterium]